MTVVRQANSLKLENDFLVVVATTSVITPGGGGSGQGVFDLTELSLN